jgi:cytochrome c oxidase assembly protein subunit 15
MTDAARLASRLALIGTLLMLLVVGLSAYLRLSAAGLGCDPWPACYAPNRTQPVEHQYQPLARLAHRILASTVGVIVLLLAFADFKARGPRRLGRAVWLIALTVALASLGRVTPGATHLAVAMGNLLGGAALTASLWWVALDPPPSSSAFAGGAVVRTRSRRVRGLAYAALALTTIQFILGALLSTTGGAGACATIPWCAEIIATSATMLHLAHRLIALALILIAGTLVIALLREPGRARWSAIALGSLLFMQAGVGALQVVFGFPLWLGLAHNLGGVMLLLAAVAAVRA